jgi:2-dehydropantoate 2-reductase
MLQDVEAGRATEIDALLGSVIELARLTQVPVPRLESVYACMRLLERMAQSGHAPISAVAASYLATEVRIHV